MPEDASIDDFLPGDGDDGGEEANLGEGEEADPGDGAEDGTIDSGAPADDGPGSAEADDDATVSTDAVEPASATSRWSAGEDGCEGCGGDASRLWRDGDRFVCADCKSWAGE